MIRRVVLFSVSVAVLSGCDDKPAPPPPDISVIPHRTEPPPAEKPRPTTQELSETKQESLTDLPLSVTIPKSWESATELGLLVLKGYTPHGSAKIHYASRGKMAGDAFDRMLEGAKRDSAKPEKKDHYKLFDIREQNGLRVLETQEVSATDPSFGTPLSWKVWIGEKKADSYDLYELSMSDLSWEDFQKDSDFLRSIVLSVKPSDK